MATVGPEYARYVVRFSVRGHVRQTTRTVTLSEGYTTWADIPRILAIGMGADVEDITIVELRSVAVPATDFDAALDIRET